MFSGLTGGQAYEALPSEGSHRKGEMIAFDVGNVRMAKQEQPLNFEPTLVRQAHREGDWVDLHSAAQPTFARDQMLQPRTKVRRGEIHEEEGSETWVQPLLLEQGGFGTRTVKDGDDRLAVFHHVAVHLVQLALLAWHHHEHTGSTRGRVPNDTPPR